MSQFFTNTYRKYRQLARDWSWYHRNRRRHLELYKPDAARSPDRDILKTYMEDGVAVVRSFLSPQVVEQIVAEVRESVIAVSEGHYSGPLRTRPMREAG